MEKYGIIKVAAATPPLQVANCGFNVERIKEQIDQAIDAGARLIVFPELAITGYTCGDLFLDQKLQSDALDALGALATWTNNKNIIVVVGLPVATHDALYNCAAVIRGGQVCGIVPKTHLPGYNEFYEPRWFASGQDVEKGTKLALGWDNVPFGTDLLFKVDYAGGYLGSFIFGVEICEDLWGPLPPSDFQALAGASVLLNLSASNEIVGKADYRRDLVKMQSGNCLGAYVYSSAGIDESTTDLVFSGHNIIAQNGQVTTESTRFTNGIVYGEIDLQKIKHDRLLNTRFRETRQLVDKKFRFVMLGAIAQTKTLTPTHVNAHPFVPMNPNSRDKVCREVFNIQTHGTRKRLLAAGIDRVVVGVSGGHDSTLALLATVKTFDMMNLPRENITAVSMPGFGTTAETKNFAEELCQILGVTFMTIPINEAVLQHFKDIGHDPQNMNHIYQNAQARERTQILMDMGFVIGTGDMSELAKGWCTYNGDHMANYGVNAGVPKTLVRYVIGWAADNEFGAAREVLHKILNKESAHELLPAEQAKTAETKDMVGPYELTDFFLYNFKRWGMPPAKLLFLATCAKFNTKYTKDELKFWLKDFFKKFFSQQFKRSCLPDSPKVGTVSLSPRGDCRLPSDACVESWIAEIDSL